MVFDFFGDKKKVIIVMVYIGVFFGLLNYDVIGGVLKFIDDVMEDICVL